MADFQAEGNQVISLESGPGNVSSTLLRQHAKTYQNIAFSVLDANKTNVFESYLQALGGLWQQGIALDWTKAIPALPTQRIALPTYAFNRKPCWVYPPSKSAEKVQAISHIATAPIVTTVQNFSVQQEVAAKPIIRTGNSSNQKERLLLQVLEILEDSTGLSFELSQADEGFIELGLDSLLLTQLALRFRKEYGLPITFRQLYDQLQSPEMLANYLLKELSREAIANILREKYEEEIPTESVQAAVPDGAMGLVLQQLQALTQQVLALQGGNIPQEQTIGPASSAPAKKLKVAEKSESTDISKEELLELKKPFGATARIDKQSAELNPKQKAFLEAFIVKYNNKTRGSKAYAEQHRDYMADPRVVSGFKPAVKEMVYPIVVNKSEGARVWDIDGNEYVDALNGFGSNFFGYNHPYILRALQQQLANGVEVGPQHELAGDVCKMICEFTNFDRAALCNTGSEAVLGAMRIARTVTGRSLIVAFNGSYHGSIDEVIVRGTSKLKSFAAAPGIMPEAVQNMLILDYGIEQTLDIIRNRADEIAAVMVEPVQSRRPEFQPIEFLKALRKLTEELDITLIFDEVITGFRTHQGGAQAIFGVQADLATYGKVIGGGMPIGAIAGKRAWMDALDGGGWQFGDDSIPEVGVTYFAGTFVRHPLALAGAKASLELMKEGGEGLHHEMQNKTQYLVTRMNKFIEKLGLPMYVATFGSLWKIKQKELALPYVELFFTLMREKGVHIWDLFPCFLTTAHTYDDIEFIAEVFEESINELITAGFLKTNAELGTTNRQRVKKASQP
ncbi:MAG: aminotransferase class III-fold pyridoxal phosphate-dependent enzyme, partial [Flexibacteraceae bacterium]